MEQWIVHLNIAHFFASVEEICNQSLRNEPFVVAKGGRSRTVVIDASPSAYGEGVRRGMSLELVKRRLKGIRIVSPRDELYRRAENRVYELASRFSPAVESLPGGHLFIDISGTNRLFGRPVDLAARIRREINEGAGMLPIAGLATNKLVSKVATRVVRPDGFVAVSPGDERSFLRHQTVSLLPGIGKRLSERMGLFGITEMGELADLTDREVSALLGKAGPRLRDAAKGIDPNPVAPHPSGLVRLRTQRVLETDVIDPAELRLHLYLLAEDVGARLRGDNLSARRIELSVGYTDSERIELHTSFQEPIHLDRDLFAAAAGLLERGLLRRVRVRSLGLSVSKLVFEYEPLDLFAPSESAKNELLQKTIDKIRGRFGHEAVRMGFTLAREPQED
jgi:DNA polymerase-4